jgi:hypothetical protein
MKNDLYTHFQQKFTMGSYRVGIGHAWCLRKACEICSSLIQKKKLNFFYYASHKLPKQQLTSFWSQGILGVNQNKTLDIIELSENLFYKKNLMANLLKSWFTIEGAKYNFETSSMDDLKQALTMTMSLKATRSSSIVAYSSQMFSYNSPNVST